MSKWSDEQWDAMHGRLKVDEVLRKQPNWKAGTIRMWLSKAECDEGFSRALDRELGLRTDKEDEQYSAYWNTKRNKAYYVFAILSFVMSLISLGLSGYAVFRKP